MFLTVIVTFYMNFIHTPTSQQAKVFAVAVGFEPKRQNIPYNMSIKKKEYRGNYM